MRLAIEVLREDSRVQHPDLEASIDISLTISIRVILYTCLTNGFAPDQKFRLLSPLVRSSLLQMTNKCQKDVC